jgi:LmeA-like phospholipid-binding
VAGILAFLLVAALVAANFVTHSVAEQTLANRVQKASGAQSVSASIDSSPFLYEVLVPATIQRVHIVAKGVPVGLVHLDQVSVDASQVRLDRHQLIADQRVHIVSIGSATVTVVVKPQGLASALLSGADLLGLRVSVANGHELAVDFLGRQIYRVDLTSSPLVPDCPFSLQEIAGGYSLSCRVAPVPQSLLNVMSRRE